MVIGWLPSTAQTEKAARGGCEIYLGKDCATSERKYPWGQDDPICGQQAVFATVAAGCGTNSTYAVGAGSALGQSPYGAYDIAGNAGEWNLDWYNGDFYSKPAATQKDPVDIEPNPTGYRAINRSCFQNAANVITVFRASSRGNRDGTNVSNYGGIRCAKPFQ